MELTRRQLAAAFVAAPAVSAQQQPQTQAEDLDGAARTRVKNTAAALADVKLPMATEPAFQFKA